MFLLAGLLGFRSALLRHRLRENIEKSATKRKSRSEKRGKVIRAAGISNRPVGVKRFQLSLAPSLTSDSSCSLAIFTAIRRASLRGLFAVLRAIKL